MKPLLIVLGLVLTAALVAGAYAIRPGQAARHTLTLRPTISVTATRPTATPTPTPPAVAGDAERGRELFRKGENGAPPCITCHQTVRNAFGFALGPNLADVAGRADERVEGMTAEEYLAESIRDPKAYVVPGYRDIMYASFTDYYNEQDIADLIAYLLTL
jgi:cytochrome c2